MGATGIDGVFIYAEVLVLIIYILRIQATIWFPYTAEKIVIEHCFINANAL